MPEKKPTMTAYLEQLQFDPKLDTGLVAKWIGNFRIIILLLLAIITVGFFSYLTIPKRLNPEIKLPIISIVTILPGASPEDVESLVTIPIETSLTGVAGVDTMTSTSRDNTSVITMQFFSSVTPEKAKADVQSIVDGVSDLPKEALTPKVRAFDFEDQPIWQFTVRGDSIPSLMRFADDLKRRLENTAKVDRVTVTGFEEQEISVIIKPDKITEYGINPLTLSGLVKSAIVSYPSGSVATGQNTFSLAIDPTATRLDDIRAIKVPINSVQVELGKIADVVERSKIRQRSSFYADSETTPTRSVTFSVYKVSTANIDEADKLMEETVSKALDDYGNRYTLQTILNTATLVDDQFTELLGEFRSTIILVMGTLFIFLGLRQALISSLTVPLTYLTAFIFMNYFGMSINFLSLFAFLIALGLLVDDTIVVVSAMTTYYQTGKFTPHQTGLIVWRDTIVPIWSTTITTIWSFVPLLLASGIIGEFIKPIPIVVTVTMISSTAIAVLITLPFMIVLMKPEIPKRVLTLLRILVFLVVLAVMVIALKSNPLLPAITVVFLILTFIFVKVRSILATRFSNRVRGTVFGRIWDRLMHYSNHGVLDIAGLGRKYNWLIKKILASKSARKKVIIGIIIYAVWAFLLLPFGFVKNEFFPRTNQNWVYVNLELPPGTNETTTETEARGILNGLRKTPELEFAVAQVGESMSAMGSPVDSPNTALITLKLVDKHKRKMTSMDIAETLRNDFKSYDAGKLSVLEESSGPPAGSDLQIMLLGDDLGELNGYAGKIAEHLSRETGVTNVDTSIKPGTSKIVFIPDRTAIAQAGLTIDSIGLWLRIYGSGFTLADVKFDPAARTKEDIVFYFSGSTQSPEALSTLSIPTPRGESYPLTALGTFQAKANPVFITRESGKRTISVSATLRPGFNAAEKGKKLEVFADSLNLPDGYSWKTGGLNEENQKSVISILQAMLAAFLLILVTMVIQFVSFRQATIVLMVIPLAVSSVFAAFALTGTPLSFPALIGVLSLFGIVVTNSMFIVDKININLKQGMKFVESIADAGESRLEPIILTKLGTVFGLLPITLSDPLWRGLGGAIISGILIASTIMLLFIPVIYFEWFKNEKGYGKR